MSFMVVALGFPYQGFLASITRDEFERGAVGLGILSSATAVGALIATLGVATLTNHRHVWRMQALAGLAFGVSLVAFGLSPTFVIGLVTAFFVGGTASAFQSLNSALAMMLSEARYYGRVQALMGLSYLPAARHHRRRDRHPRDAGADGPRLDRLDRRAGAGGPQHRRGGRHAAPPHGDPPRAVRAAGRTRRRRGVSQARGSGRAGGPLSGARSGQR
jgi:hypothetical protein